MKRYIRSNQHVSNYPEYIEVKDDATWLKYKKLHTYVSDDGETCCYYVIMNNDPYYIVTSQISLYPNGHLTFLWNGYDQPYNAEWREVQ